MILHALSVWFAQLLMIVGLSSTVAETRMIADAPVVPARVAQKIEAPTPVPTSAQAAPHTDTAGAASSLPEGSPWLTTLPLGDGKFVADAPKKGYIYLCHVGGDGGGAQAAGTWIDTAGKTWRPADKLAVSGNVSWPTASITDTVSGDTRTIVTNDLPTTHTTGIFPIATNDAAYAFDRNPNSIRAQSFSFSLPAHPVAAAQPGCIFGEVGVMTNGVLLFDGFDAGNRDAAAWEVQDTCDAHPQVSGAYHYHSMSSCLPSMKVSDVVGFAFDGFPITGPKLPSGNYLTTKDLDECHGITSEIMLDGAPTTLYHYVLTQDFPYSVSCFKGTSSQKGPVGGAPSAAGGQSNQEDPSRRQGGSAGDPPAGGPPPEALSACNGKTVGTSCAFVSPRGDSITGRCDTPPGQSLACVPR